MFGCAWVRVGECCIGGEGNAFLSRGGAKYYSEDCGGALFIQDSSSGVVHWKQEG